jgi:energy-coupling factor transporter ATP-binding protein EcfA2
MPGTEPNTDEPPEPTHPNPEATRPNDVLCFEQLRVTRFDGIEHGLEVELSSGVNVIYGSNAAGKTTLARAMRGLLWPGRVDGQLPIAEARFLLDGSTWRVELEGEGCGYTRDQSPASRPALPPADHGPRYHLYLHDLLGKDGGEEAFAKRILREAQGGIDVEGTAEELGFEVPSRRRAKITKAVEELRKKRDETKANQKDLRRREQTLDDLRGKKAEAEEAAKRVSALQQAKEVAAAREALSKAEATLDQFPAVMDEVQGSEDEKLESLQEKLSTAEEKLREAEDQIQEAEETIEESLIPEEGLPEGRIEELRSVVSTIREQERTVREQKSEVTEAEASEEKTWGRLPAGVDKDAASEIDLPELEEIESHAKAAKDLQGRREALETAKELFETGSPDTPVGALRDGLKHLHRWLQLPSTGAQPSFGWLHWAVVVGGLLVAGSGGLLISLGTGLAIGVGVGLIVLGVLIAGAEWRRGAQDEEERATGRSDQRVLHEKEYERLGLEEPTDWSREAVEERVDALLGRLREAHVAAEEEETWGRYQSEFDDLDGREKKLDQERQRLAEELGVDPSAGSFSLPVLFERLTRWQRAYDDVAGKREALNTAKEEAKTCRNRLNEALEEYNLGPIEDASGAEGAVSRLGSARDEFREAKRGLKQAGGQKESAIQDRDDAQDKIKALHDRLNLEEGAEAKLRDLVDRHDAYQETVEGKRTAKAKLDAALSQLRQQEKHEEWMEEATEEKLKRHRAEAERKAEEEEDYLQQINTIEHEIETARDKGTLEERQAKYRERRDKLAAERERDYEKAVGKALADFIQEETQDQGLPPVFHRARKLFAEITDYRYRLMLDRGNSSFRAFDHTYEKAFALGELSSGTQVQLVLSVRLAFLETQEQRCRVPLVLDETLANSDENRARAIIEAVKTICENGRQVLYLTAQEDEVQKWNAQLDGEGEPGGEGGSDGEGRTGGERSPEHSIVSLGELDTRDLVEPGGDGVAVPARRRAPDGLPDPETTTHEKLQAVLEVPRWSPRQPVGRLHLWYLIRSPELLIGLIESGTRTWGQLENLHHIGGVAATSFDERTFGRVLARAQAVEIWKEAWHIGRGEPVDRPALEQTDAVTEKYIDGVSEIAEEQNGNAESVLRIIRARNDERVKGFHSSKADDLEEYFLEHGYLVRQDPLMPEEMWQRALAHLTEERSEGLLTEEELEALFGRIRPS